MRVVLAAAPQSVCAYVCISYLLLIPHQFISFITLSTMSGGSCSSDRLIKPKLSRVKTEDWGGEVSYSTDKISQYTACPYNSRHLTELQPTANSNRALAFDSDFVAGLRHAQQRAERGSQLPSVMCRARPFRRPPRPHRLKLGPKQWLLRSTPSVYCHLQTKRRLQVSPSTFGDGVTEITRWAVRLSGFALDILVNSCRAAAQIQCRVERTPAREPAPL